MLHASLLVTPLPHVQPQQLYENLWLFSFSDKLHCIRDLKILVNTCTAMRFTKRTTWQSLSVLYFYKKR